MESAFISSSFSQNTSLCISSHSFGQLASGAVTMIGVESLLKLCQFVLISCACLCCYQFKKANFHCLQSLLLILLFKSVVVWRRSYFVVRSISLLDAVLC